MADEESFAPIAEEPLLDPHAVAERLPESIAPAADDANGPMPDEALAHTAEEPLLDESVAAADEPLPESIAPAAGDSNSPMPDEALAPAADPAESLPAESLGPAAGFDEHPADQRLTQPSQETDSAEADADWVAQPADESVRSEPVRLPLTLRQDAITIDAPTELRILREEAEFFRNDSFPPVVEELSALGDVEFEAQIRPELTPQQLARRTRLRKAVGWSVALITLCAIAALIIGTRQTTRETTPRPAQPPAVAEFLPPPVEPSTASVVAPSLPAPETADSTSLATAPPTTAELEAELIALLEKHQSEQAIEVARALVEAQPDHAFGYRCWGAALQDLGRWGEAAQIYGQCAQQARRGNVEECRALSGRRK